TGSFLVEGDWQTDLPVELTILDLNGRRVFFKQVMQPVPNQRIELETELSSGMYLLQTTQGSEQILQRLVIY
ncbi:MAG: T9SS type A sorting domain-containing protein, partial [Salibacteraceae bacterium]